MSRPDPEELRLDECSAYITHILREYKNIGDYTFFLQADPFNHMHMSYLKLILRTLNNGLPIWTHEDAALFLPLGAPRHLLHSSPCLQYYHTLTIGYPNKDYLSAYCCAHFMVTKRGIQLQPEEYYLALLERLLTGTDACVDGAERSTQCYMLEFLWHVIFQEESDPPLRSDDTRLSSPLRLEEGFEHDTTDWPRAFGPRVPPHEH